MRGERHPLGFERVAQNGYHYIKTPQGWKLRHHLVAEKKLGRPVDTMLERVVFKDRDRTNFDPENIEVIPKLGVTVEDKKLRLQERIDALQGELNELEAEEIA